MGCGRIALLKSSRFSESMKKTILIRDREQLTIPDNIRKRVSWIYPMSAITISLVNDSEIILTPMERKINWLELWSMIKKSREIEGSGRVKTSDFLTIDRNSH